MKKIIECFLIILAIIIISRTSALGVPEDLQFEYTTERVFSSDAPDGDTYIDMETGNVYHLPANLNGNKNEMLMWLKEKGIDLSVRLREGQICYVASIEAFTRGIPNDKWPTISPAELYADRELQQAEVGYGNITKHKKDLPRTYLCKTRQGRIGLFQIVDFVNNSNDLRIRYKIAQKSAPKTMQNTKRMKQLFDEQYNIRATITEQKRMLSLPDAEARLAEYKKKRADLKNSEPSSSPEQQQWEEFKQSHGDKYQQVYSQTRAAAGQIIVAEAIDSEIEPFARATQIGWKEGHERLSGLLGLDPKTDPDEIWSAYKAYLAKNKGFGQEYLEEIIKKYNVPQTVVQHARWDSKKEYYGLGYKYLIDLFSEEKIKKMQKRLKEIEIELASYD